MTKEEHNIIENIKNWKTNKNLIIHDRVFIMKPINEQPARMMRVFEQIFEELEHIGDFNTEIKDWKLKCLEQAGALNNETIFAHMATYRINNEKI